MARSRSDGLTLPTYTEAFYEVKKKKSFNIFIKRLTKNAVWPKFVSNKFSFFVIKSFSCFHLHFYIWKKNSQACSRVIFVQ